MCGIAGIVMPDGCRPDEAALARMAAAMNHRGPDASGWTVRGRVGLVHARLSIVDPTPSGAQPMESSDGSCVLVYNGEVFNHASLRSAHSVRAWRGHSDTETVLERLATDGPVCLPEFNGLFALALLDLRRGVLHLARDRWGVKPLYVARHAGMFAFASELEVLFEAGVPRHCDRVMLRQAMQGWVPGSGTPLAGVTRLLPGHSLTVDLSRGEERLHRWFRPADLVDPEAARALSGLSEEQAADRLEDELRAAVGRRLMSDVPLGTMCSGGVDSSVVTALASHQQPVIAYSAAVCDQPEVDESPFARTVALALGVDLRVIELTGSTWRRDLVETVRHVGYPLTHANSVPMFQIAAAARDDGVKVLLSGEGADELLGGYDYLHHREYRQFLDAADPARAALQSARAWLRHRGWAGDAAAAGWVSAHARAFQRSVVADAMTAYSHHRGSRRRLEAALLSDLSTYLPHLLNRQDKSTMQASVETRLPFLDPNVVACAVNLPLERRITPGRKWPLKVLADRVLPAEISRRPKMGFGFDEGLYLHGFTREDFVLSGELRDHLQVPMPTWVRHCSSASGLGLLLLWTGEIWCRAFLSGQSTQQIDAALWR